MDYKKIIKSRALRLQILRMLSFIPDKPMLKMQYRIKTGRRLDLKNPKRFTEKLQWYKLYYKDPKMIQCVDKYDVRDYVKSKGLDGILIPCYGVYDSVDEIDWDALPNQFVMKDTLGGGGVSLAIVKDKSKENIEMLKGQARKWTAIDAHRRDGGREWPYYCGKNHRVIIEKYIHSDKAKGGLLDYKLFCFQGKIEFLYVAGYREMGDSVRIGLFDRDFNRLPVQRVGDVDIGEVTKPENFAAMVETAEKLAQDFPHVRVDLYSVENKVLFGELTFYNASGYMLYEPDGFDAYIGQKFELVEYKQT